MDKFSEYYGQFVVPTEQGIAVVCKACPSTISAKTSTELTKMIQSHFEKNHKKKEGMYYCYTCLKSVCNVGQKEQLEYHYSSAQHIGKENRIGSPFEACTICAAVNPPRDHNPNHSVQKFTFVAGTEEKLSEKEFAEKILSIATKKAQCGDVSIGAMCNEHFEKLFNCNWNNAPIPMGKHGNDVACGVCRRLSGIWPEFKIRRGPKLTVCEQRLRKYVVGQISTETDAKHPPVLSPAEYGKLDDETQELYDFVRERKAFVLRRQKAKDLIREDFLRGGASGDRVDGNEHGNDSENEDQEEEDDYLA